MPRTTSLESIERQIEALQQKAEKLKEKDKGPALKEIADLMRIHDIDLSELRGAMNGRRPKRGRPAMKKGGRKSKLRGRKVKPLYRDPKTGDTWSGRGRPARWLADAEKAGRKRDQFLIKR